MKKFFSILSVAALCFLVSCKSKEESATSGGMSDAAKKNLDAMHTVNKAFETGDVSMIDSVVAADFVDHYGDKPSNRDSLKSMIAMMKTGVKDQKTEIKYESANDEYAMEWMRMTGTNVSMTDMAPGPYDMTSVEMVRFNKDGKAIEHWSFMQMSDMMNMMKNMPPPPVKDTAKMK